VKPPSTEWVVPGAYTTQPIFREFDDGCET